MKYWNNKAGIMESWKTGISGKENHWSFTLLNPLLHCSNIPPFQIYSIIPTFQCFYEEDFG
jgi:hypothetical protein